jgi:hypothetical protein
MPEQGLKVIFSAHARFSILLRLLVQKQIKNLFYYYCWQQTSLENIEG